MSSDTMYINFKEENDKLAVIVIIPNQTSKIFHLTLDDKMTDQYIFLWIIQQLKPFFLELMQGKLEIKADILHCNEAIFVKLSEVLKRTKQVLNAYIADNVYNTNENKEEHILFYNVNHDSWICGLYQDYLQTTKEAHLLYRNMNTAYDLHSRQRSSNIEMMSPEQLLTYIIENNIRKVITVNQYYLENLLSEHDVYLLPILQYLNVEFISIDYDTYDAPVEGFITKAVCTDNRSHRFSTYPHFQTYWDDFYESKNVHYVINPQHFGLNQTLHPLQNDYKIAILANARLEFIRPNLGALLYLSDLFSGENFFSDFNRWFYAMRQLILYRWGLTDFQRTYYNALLHGIYVAALSFMRFEVITQLSTDRCIEIYGDKDWGYLFPQYYQHKYLNHEEKNNLFAKRCHLYLLFNNNYTYMETNPVVMDALSKGIPFINYPPLVKTSHLHGLSHLEYDTMGELNSRVNNINRFLSNDGLEAALTYYRTILAQNEEDVRQNIVKGHEFPIDGGIYGKSRCEHEVLVEQLLNHYIDEHKEMLHHCFETLFLNRSSKTDISKTRLYERDYVQKLLRLDRLRG